MKLKMNFQGEKSGADTLRINAFISLGISSTEVNKKVHEEYLDAFYTNETKDSFPVYCKKNNKVIETKVYKPFKVATGLTVHASQWDNVNKKALGAYTEVNDKLDLFQEAVIRLYAMLSEQETKEVEPKYLADQIKIHIRKKVKSPTPEQEKKPIVLPGHFNEKYINGVPTKLINYVQFKIDQYVNKPFLEHGKTDATITTYRSFLSNLKDYKTQTEIELDLLSISVDDCKTFITHFLKKGKPKTGEPYKWNYASIWKTNFKKFIMQAVKDKVPVKVDLEDEFFQVSWEREDDPYLTLDQLKLLRELKFDADQKQLELVRDYFLLGCACGASFVDLSQIKHLFHNQYDGWHFEYTRNKTFRKKVQSIKIKIPVREQYIVDLYKKKYKGEFNLNLSDVKFNVHLKSVCLLAGLKEPVQYATQNPLTGKVIKTTKKLFDTISTKCMRKSFASNEVRFYHTPLIVVKGWTQHSSEKALMDYIMLSEQDYYNMTNSNQNRLMKK